MITDADRRRLHAALADNLGEEAGALLMELLPPAGWNELVTRGEFNAGAESVRAEFDKVGAEFERVYAEFDKVYAEFGKVEAEFDRVRADIDVAKTELPPRSTSFGPRSTPNFLDSSQPTSRR